MQLAIDCASDEVGIALAVEGVARVTLTWETQQNHSVELLPNIERLLANAGRTKADLDAVFVDRGPGGYAALRVGVSTAKAMAHALRLPLVAVGRLELDAYGVVRDAGERRIVAVHRAGRGELAWAAYGSAGDGGWHQASPPALIKRDDFVFAIEEDDALTGEIDDALERAISQRFREFAGFLPKDPTEEDYEAFSAALNRALEENDTEPARVLHPGHHRVAALAALGHARLSGGRTDDPTALVPLYLRAPAIGPQP